MVRSKDSSRRATRPNPGWALLVPVLLLSVVVQVNCKGCAERAAGSRASPEVARDARDKLQPVNVEIDMPIGELPEGLELGPTEPKPWLQYAGMVDVEDRYGSVVMIAAEDPEAPVFCSGVLVSERLVFTAGSCVCGPRPPGELELCPLHEPLHRSHDDQRQRKSSAALRE